MTGRERFLRIAKGELTGELFLPFNFNYGWFMQETLDRWREQGMSADVNLREFFGFDRVEFADGRPYQLVPPFEEEVLSEDEGTIVLRDEDGVTKRIFKRHADSKMPQWLDRPVKSRSDFEELKSRLDPHSSGRFPEDLDERKKQWKGRDHPLGVVPGSFYGHTLLKWVGTERLCILLYDDPRFVHTMLDYLEWFFLELLSKLLRGVGFDFASFGEDIAYKGRSFMSPAMFKEFIQPHYVSICELLRGHGVGIIFVDSDGYLDELIPLWMEVGITGFSPLEVAAGMDALALKRKYGNDIVLAGNVDKRALIRGKADIDHEIDKVKQLLDLGGYFPAVDHSIPPDVPYANFQYFLSRLRSL